MIHSDKGTSNHMTDDHGFVSWSHSAQTDVTQWFASVESKELSIVNYSVSDKTVLELRGNKDISRQEKTKKMFLVVNLPLNND